MEGDRDMRMVIVPDLSVGSREWWIGEAQVCELVGLGGRELRLREVYMEGYGKTVFIEVPDEH